MIQLALETSTRNASVAVLDGAKTLGETTLNRDQPGTSALLPAIATLLTSSALNPAEVQQICVSTGPGSFTGLRMGIAAAKTWAWAKGCRLIGIPTHRVIAEQMRCEAISPDCHIASVIDAQRGEWFVELFRAGSSGSVESVQPSQVVIPQDFLDSLAHPTLMSGPGLLRHHDRIRITRDIRLADQDHWLPRAETVGQLAHTDQFASLDPFRLRPEYGRKSAAEEKLDSG
ncbi:MAG: tRNA (adenosine(37)-N6)-threonylcarbamoyltransferase complex dimerization subunit type 1 TsaB [Pirellulaceae bacterium]